MEAHVTGIEYKYIDVVISGFSKQQTVSSSYGFEVVVSGCVAVYVWRMRVTVTDHFRSWGQAASCDCESVYMLVALWVFGGPLVVNDTKYAFAIEGCPYSARTYDTFKAWYCFGIGLFEEFGHTLQPLQM